MKTVHAPFASIFWKLQSLPLNIFCYDSFTPLCFKHLLKNTVRFSSAFTAMKSSFNKYTKHVQHLILYFKILLNQLSDYMICVILNTPCLDFHQLYTYNSSRCKIEFDNPSLLKLDYLDLIRCMYLNSLKSYILFSYHILPPVLF